MGSYHARLSPSSASRWTSCTASIQAQEGLRDEGSDAARLGTCQHQLSAECLEHNLDPQSYLNRVMHFYADADDRYKGEDWAAVDLPEGVAKVTHEVVVTQDMVDASAAYINFVREIVETSGGTLFVEQRVPIGHITGEEGAGGTSDAVIAAGEVLIVCDAKFGRAKVNAYEILEPARIDVLTGESVPEKVQMNLQAALYALGSLEKYGFFGDFKYIKAVIVQPYMRHVSEYTCNVEELLALGEWLKERAEATRTNPVFVPDFDSCHFCKAKFTCKARESAALETALVGFDDIDQAQPRVVKPNQLGSIYARIEFVKDWCRDVETRVYEELTAGRPVMRNDGLQYKLVAGKQGARAWRDPAEAEALMNRMRLRDDVMYTRSLISPSIAEKLAKVKKAKKGEVAPPPTLGQTQWKRIEALIHQPDGSPSVALETDPRPAYNPLAGFEDEEVPAAGDCSDLF